MSNEIEAVDMQLHMAVKELAVLQGEINCTLKELVKKAELLRENEEMGQDADYLLGMISVNFNELTQLFEQKKNLARKVEDLRQTETVLL
ncbi:hypothetical protein AC477_04155 [miscellaneous Crenarchaeota group-1 archaeon SG8-32-1]|uniref:Uncharacterized protein n=1 Tax=miscellaneous Crenarchaeota group-1 archaeon SG8-32-1 TaxID=1685124 RepID=A0A0M0BSL5_9ARCH|nr:MAG: hypothetical protein AC477_04155 [miscellaneous Crenarchaeota group-1 archaeon SG8-32-1]